jgi:GTP-binding protein
VVDPDPAYHAKTHVFPVGFRSERLYASVADPTERVPHFSEVLRGDSGPVFRVSALAADGTEALCYAIMEHIEAQRVREQGDPEAAAAEREIQSRMQAESRERIAALAEARRRARSGEASADDGDFDDDEDDGVEVIYAP